jgi:hypothetical protein
VSLSGVRGALICSGNKGKRQRNSSKIPKICDLRDSGDIQVAVGGPKVPMARQLFHAVRVAIGD